MVVGGPLAADDAVSRIDAVSASEDDEDEQRLAALEADVSKCAPL